MLRSRTMAGSDVIILFGGTSNERRVSVASAQNVSAVLDEAEAWFLAPSGAVHRVTREELAGFQRHFERDLLPARSAEFPSVVAAFESQPSHVYFLALHGGEGEDGTIQRMLEARRIAFTGPGADASARAFDKEVAKQVVNSTAVRIAHSVHLSKDPKIMRNEMREMLAIYGRIVTKPVAGGSSVGLYHLLAPDEVDPAARKMEESGEPYLAEEFISGTELTVGVVDGPGGARALPLAAHRALGCEGYSRTDVIAQARGPVFLELNTLPGLTRASFLPQQLAAEGTSMLAFLEGQLTIARARRDR